MRAAHGGGRIFALNKPRGLVVSRADEHGRPTVYSVLPSWALTQGWMPAGRLDLDSSGLLLFAREGAVLDMLTRPGHLEKAYKVVVRGHVQTHHVQTALGGVPTPVGPLRAAALTVGAVAHGKSTLEVILKEGKNRHIRRIFAAMKDDQHGTALKVMTLRRVRVGSLVLDTVPGGWRWLTDPETDALLGRASGNAGNGS